MAAGLIRSRMSCAVSVTLVRSSLTVWVRPARVCSVSRLICSSERLSVCVIGLPLPGEISEIEPAMRAFVPLLRDLNGFAGCNEQPPPLFHSVLPNPGSRSATASGGSGSEQSRTACSMKASFSVGRRTDLRSDLSLGWHADAMRQTLIDTSSRNIHDSHNSTKLDS